MRRAMGCLNSVARLMCYLMASILIFSLPFSIFAHNSLRTLFSSNHISNAVTNLLLLRGGFREQLVENIISDTWFDSVSDTVSGTLANLSPEDRIEIAQIIFPENWLKTQVQENLTILMEWFGSEESVPRVMIDLEPLRVELEQGGSFRIAEIWVDSLPVCTSEQELEFEEAWLQGSPVGNSRCKPRDELRQRMIGFTEQELLQKIDDMPAKISLLDELDFENVANSLGEFRQNILILLLLMRWLRLLPFLFLGMLLTLTIRSWQDMRKWWGIPVGLGSLFTIVVIVIGVVVGPGILKNAFSQSTSIIELQERIVNVVWGLLSTVLKRSAIQAIVLLIVAVLVLILPILLGKNKEDQTLGFSSADSSGEVTSDFPPPPEVKPFRPETIADVTTDDPSAENTQ
jgi:hypothetical protein